MGTIICATRGGEASYQTQDIVIEMAKVTGDKLVFVFAVDTHFLDKTSGPILVDVESELDNMAEFLLIMARERAAKADIEAEQVVKHGDLRSVLLETTKEQNATLIVLGSPGSNDGKSRFVLEGLQDFAAGLQENSGIEVQIV